MSLWILIPVKPLEEAKSRLAGMLRPAARRALAKRFFLSTLRTALGFRGGQRVLVASRSKEVLRLARRAGAVCVHEGFRPEMNAGLRVAARHALGRGATALLVLSTDLPWLTAADLAAICAEPGRAAIAPDRHGTGCNGFYWPLRSVPPFVFGGASFAAFMRAVGGEARIVRREGLGFDVDDAADYRVLRRGVRRKNVLF